MFLTTPTISELLALELPTLTDMLAQQTSLYIKLVNDEGVSHRSNACKDNILNLQIAIESKKNVEKTIGRTASIYEFKGDKTSNTSSK